MTIICLTDGEEREGARAGFVIEGWNVEGKVEGRKGADLMVI